MTYLNKSVTIEERVVLKPITSTNDGPSYPSETHNVVKIVTDKKGKLVGSFGSLDQMLDTGLGN